MLTKAEREQLRAANENASDIWGMKTGGTVLALLDHINELEQGVRDVFEYWDKPIGEITRFGPNETMNQTASRAARMKLEYAQKLRLLVPEL